MSITRSLNFTRRAWTTPNLLDPGLPAGYWVAAGRQEGDASGGAFTWQHIFASPSAGLGDPSSFYSIEQTMISVSIAQSQSVEMQVLDMDPFTAVPPSEAVPCTYRWGLVATGQGDNGIDPLPAVNTRIWIGRFAGKPTDTGLINVVATNPTGSDFFTVKIQGYYWGPGAMNAVGGIRLPANGIYGRS